MTGGVDPISDDAGPGRSFCQRAWPVVRLFVGIAISVLCLWLVVRQVQWDRVAGCVRTADVSLLLLAACVYPVRLLVISVRWGGLLRLHASAPPLLVRLRATSIGYLANNVLPFRSGEVIRGGIAATAGTPVGAVAMTLVFEKLLDLWTLSACALLCGAPYLRHAPALASPLRVVGLIAGASLAAYLLAVATCGSPRLTAWLDRLRFPGSAFVARVVRVLLESCRLCHRGRLLGAVVAATTANWALEATASLLMARALGIPLSFPAALFIVAVVGLGLTLPSSPGGIGLSQYLVVLALTVQGADVNAAAALSIVGFVVAYLAINLIGVGFLISSALARRLPKHAHEASATTS